MIEYMNVSKYLFDEEFKRTCQKVVEYDKDSSTADEELHKFYLIRRDAFIWIRRISEK